MATSGATSVDVTRSSGSTDPLVGSVIHDRFRIIAPIARGGMGAVYRAEQAPLGRLVAIKVLSPKHDEDKDPEFRKRFFLEAATVAKLSHPNTVTVFDYGQSEGLFFIVMELLEGITLKTALEQDGPFPPGRAIHVLNQICRSLREAHRLHIIHRDMKPGNVMLLEQGDEKDYAKVLDFGLVKDTDAEEEEDLTQAGVFMGSPKYMSPEQIQGERVDARSDIYSVGVVLYEMLTGAPPFVRDKQVQILMDHISTPVPPLVAPEGHPPIPDELAAVAYKCLAKKREDRFEDMDALLAALKVASGEDLRLTGEYSLASGGTSVSGVHALGDPLRSTHSGSIPIPNLSASGAITTSGPTITPSTVVSDRALGQPVARSPLPLILGIAAVLAIVGGVVAFVLPGDTPPETTSSTPDPQPGPAAAQPTPRPTPEPTPEPALQPAPIPPQAAEDPAPAPIRSVLVDLQSTPAGATVRVGDTEYGPTPAQVEMTGPNAEAGTELTFVFALAGHRDTTITRVVPAEGRLEVSARMVALPRRPIRARPTTTSTGPPRPSTPAGYRDSPY